MWLTRKPASNVLRDYDSRIEFSLQRHQEYALIAEQLRQEKNYEIAKAYRQRSLFHKRNARRVLTQRQAFVNKLITLENVHAAAPLAAPRIGERMLLFVLCTKEERANIPGDLEEEFKQIAAKHGGRFAKVWYYKQVAASAWPLIRKAVKWGVWAWAGEWIRRII